MSAPSEKQMKRYGHPKYSTGQECTSLFGERADGDYMLVSDRDRETADLRREVEGMRDLLREARHIVFDDHMREIGTRVLAPYTLTARIDAALAATRKGEQT